MAVHNIPSSPQKTATTTTTTGQAMKYTVEYHRKDGVSEEEFMDRFTNQFMPLVIRIMRKHNIMKYAVEKTDPQVRAAFQGGGWKVNDCDVVVDYWVNDLKSMKDFASDPEWNQAMVLDQNENDWLDTAKSTVRISYEPIAAVLEDKSIDMVKRQKRRSRVTASFE